MKTFVSPVFAIFICCPLVSALGKQQASTNSSSYYPPPQLYRPAVSTRTAQSTVPYLARPQPVVSKNRTDASTLKALSLYRPNTVAQKTTTYSGAVCVNGSANYKGAMGEVSKCYIRNPKTGQVKMETTYCAGMQAKSGKNELFNGADASVQAKVCRTATIIYKPQSRPGGTIGKTSTSSHNKTVSYHPMTVVSKSTSYDLRACANGAVNVNGTMIEGSKCNIRDLKTGQLRTETTVSVGKQLKTGADSGVGGFDASVQAKASRTTTVYYNPKK